MFCPRCAAQNVDDAKFCRACGADISLVPQALTGQLAEGLAAGQAGAEEHRKRRGEGEVPRLEKAVSTMATGVAFILIFSAACSSSAADL